MLFARRWRREMMQENPRSIFGKTGIAKVAGTPHRGGVRDSLGKLVSTMGDKSPKNARKSGKQKADARTAKDNKKRDGDSPAVEPLVLGEQRRRISVGGPRLFA